MRGPLRRRPVVPSPELLPSGRNRGLDEWDVDSDARTGARVLGFALLFVHLLCFRPDASSPLWTARFGD